MLSRLSDFVVCSTSLYIGSSRVYIQGLEHDVKLKFSLADRINTIFKHCHPCLISENVGNLLIFTEKVLDLRPNSVCAVEMAMYVLHWT